MFNARRIYKAKILICYDREYKWEYIMKVLSFYEQILNAYIKCDEHLLYWNKNNCDDTISAVQVKLWIITVKTF